MTSFLFFTCDHAQVPCHVVFAVSRPQNFSGRRLSWPSQHGGHRPFLTLKLSRASDSVPINVPGCPHYSRSPGSLFPELFFYSSCEGHSPLASIFSPQLFLRYRISQGLGRKQIAPCCGFLITEKSLIKGLSTKGQAGLGKPTEGQNSRAGSSWETSSPLGLEGQGPRGSCIKSPVCWSCGLW